MSQPETKKSLPEIKILAQSILDDAKKITVVSDESVKEANELIEDILKLTLAARSYNSPSETSAVTKIIGYLDNANRFVTAKLDDKKSSDGRAQAEHKHRTEIREKRDAQAKKREQLKRVEEKARTAYADAKTPDEKKKAEELLAEFIKQRDKLRAEETAAR